MQDVALVDLMRRNPDAGLAAVYEHYADRIHDYCRSILRDDADAADATQDTFLAASARIGQLREPGRLRPWLYAIARNRSYRTIRDREHQRPTDDLEAAMSPADPVGAGRLESDEASALVWEAAGGLDVKDRDVLDLHLRHGLDGADLADVLGVTAPQANQAMHRMRERLNRSVGAALALRYGRRDCEELQAIVGADSSLTPLLRKRVARHIEACGTCQEYRSLGATLFAAIPFVPAPGFLGPALLSTGAGGQASEQAAARIDWDPNGFPTAPTQGAAVSPAIGQALHATRPRPTRLMTVVSAAAVAVVVVVAGGFLLGRFLAGDDSTDVAASDTVVTSTEPDPTSSSSVPASTATTTDGSTSAQGTDSTTTTSATGSPSTATLTITTPTTDTSNTTDPVPTVTFIADGQAPTLSLARDCGNQEVRLTATISDNLDPAPMGDLMLTWPTNRTRGLSSTGAGGYEVVLQGDDLSGFSGPVAFTVSGRITDAAGNLADVFDSVTCIFGID